MAKIAVFGSYVMDLTCKAPHIPVVNETLLSGPFVMGPGGKGFNQAVAASLAGVDVGFVTKIGTDLYNPFVRQAFARFGLSLDYLYETGESATGVALIVVDESGNNAIAVSPGACELLSAGDADRAAAAFAGASVLLTQLEANLAATTAAMKRAHEAGATVILNPAPYRPVPESFFDHVDILLPNEVECSYMTGIDVVDRDTASVAAEKLSTLAGTVIITLGDRGVYCPKVSDSIIPALSVDAIDTTGAGDAFAGVFAAYLARGAELADALRYAIAAAALSTTRFGTSPSMPAKDEIEAAVRQL